MQSLEAQGWGGEELLGRWTCPSTICLTFLVPRRYSCYTGVTIVALLTCFFAGCTDPHLSPVSGGGEAVDGGKAGEIGNICNAVNNTDK